MPCLSGRFDPAIGPLISVGLLQVGTLGQPAPVPVQLTTFPALIDTGASMTCIAASVAQAVGLRPTGMRSMISATHSVPVNAYLADLILPFGATSFVVQGHQVVEFSPGAGSPFQILIGRDILCQGTFSLSFDGHFTFSL